MGDRGNIAVQGYWQSEARVYLYTHWGGECLGSTLQQALAKRQRWDDPAYLTHIICDVMQDIEGTHGSETGMGISTSISDNEHVLLIVDTRSQVVRFESDAGMEVREPLSFDDFVLVGATEYAAIDSCETAHLGATEALP